MRRQHKFRPEINLDKLWSLVGAEKFAELEKEKSTKAPVIDLVQFVSVPPTLTMLYLCLFLLRYEDTPKAMGGLNATVQLLSPCSESLTDPKQ